MPFHQVRELLTQLGVEESAISQDTTLNDLGLDSTEMVELSLLFKAAFGRQVPAKWFKGKNVADLVHLVGGPATHEG